VGAAAAAATRRAAGGGAAAAAGGKKLTIEDEILALPKRPAPLMRQLGLQ
jgi:DNA-directed RNA polymerase III subunit RPC1